MDPQLLSVRPVIDDSVEASRRATGDDGPRFEGAEGLSLAPGGGKDLRESSVRRDHDAGKNQREERNRSADLPEERSGGLGDRAAHIAPSDLVPRVVAGPTEAGPADDAPARRGQDRPAGGGPPPQPTRERGERRPLDGGWPSADSVNGRSP